VPRGTVSLNGNAKKIGCSVKNGCWRKSDVPDDPPVNFRHEGQCQRNGGTQGMDD